MKKILIIVAVLAIIIAALWLGKPYLDKWNAGAEQREQAAYLAEQEASLDVLVEAYKADTYGGATPQETWEMFITALEAGDTDLAAKYFVPEKQEEWKVRFEKGKENGALVSFLKDDLPLVTGSRMYDRGDTFEFYTDDIDNGPGFVYILKLNKQANIWKISDL